MPRPSLNLISKSFIIAKPYWRYLGGIFVLHLIATPITLMKPLPLKILIDNGFGNHPLPTFIHFLLPSGFSFTFQTIVFFAAGLFIIVALIENLYTVAIWVLSIFTGEKIVLNFRTLLFNHVQQLSLKYHDQKGASDSLFRIQYDTMAIRTLLIGNISPIIAALVTLTGMLIILFMIMPVFAGIAFCLIPLLFILSRTSAQRLQDHWRLVKEDEGMAVSVIHEVLNSIRVVKAFGQEEQEIKRFKAQADKAVKGQLKVGWLGATYYFIIEMLFAVGTAVFLFVGALYVKSGKLTLGELTLMLAYLAQIYGPLVKISKNINDIQSSLTSIDRVFSVLENEIEVKECSRPVPLYRTTGQLSLSHVGFYYDERKPVLEDVSFDIEAGERVGIIGSTGSGKTSLISLLMRFYDCTSGRILLDGMDIRKFRLNDYRKQFAMVLQEPVLFTGTIAENIRFGNPLARKDEVIKAAKLANAHDFISSCTNGYETLVGDRGMQLSGGERQRISLARAFVKDAAILVLDEPTSSIDIKTESQIIEAMERLMEGRTSFLITHRLEALRTSNKIIHLEKGRIVDILKNASSEVLETKKRSILYDINPI